MPTGFNFSERVRHILSNAKSEADMLGQVSVAPEHILLALLNEPDGVASGVLQNLNVDVDRVKKGIEREVPQGAAGSGALADALPYTDESKAVLERTVEEAKAMLHSYVGTEHLLLGLLNSSGTVPARLLAEQGLTADGVGAETMRLLGPPPERAD
jgi:ATP-dependent Clp protease ATP-binding subunit ClpC